MSRNQFVPFMCIIERISNAQNAVIGFFRTHAFVVNEYVRVHNYPIYGMMQIDNMRGKIVRTTQFEIIVNIDTTQFGEFHEPVFGKKQSPCVVPAGSGVDLTLYASTMILNDCFDNRLIS